MATVYELARELGNEVLKTKEIETLMEAKKVFDTDVQATTLLEEYTKIQQDMQARIAAGHMSVEEQQSINAVLAEKSEKIKSNAAATALFQAENEFNSFMNSIMSVIQSTISGQDPNECGCGGSCGSCEGGCH